MSQVALGFSPDVSILFQTALLLFLSPQGASNFRWHRVWVIFHNDLTAISREDLSENYTAFQYVPFPNIPSANVIEGSLEARLPTIWANGKAQPGRNSDVEKVRRDKIRDGESQKREDAGA